MEFRIPPREGMAARAEEMERRMAEWGEQVERRMRERFDQRGPSQPSMQGPGPDDRIRRLEERLDQLLRELERDRAERRGRANDA